MPPGAVKTGWNEPQLSEEMKKRFDELCKSNWYESSGLGIGEVEDFLATALEEQKKATLELLDKAELEKWFDMPDTTENWRTWKKIRNIINGEKASVE